MRREVEAIRSQGALNIQAMPNEIEGKEKLKYGVAATLTRIHAENQAFFFECVAKLLEDALPSETQVIRKGGIFSKKKVEKVTISIKQLRYALEDVGGGSLHPERVRIVHNIALKTESIPLDMWVDEVSAYVEEKAKTDRPARKALSRIARRDESRIKQG